MPVASTGEQIQNDPPNSETSKQILIAEDEPAIRRLLQTLLKMWGFRTLVAQDGKEALEVAENHLDDIDILLSDVTMPKMDGPQLAEKLTAKRPGIKVILMSGFSRVQVALRHGWKFLQKPFKPADVKKVVDEVL